MSDQSAALQADVLIEEQATLLLGAAFSLSTARSAALAELLAQFNVTTPAEIVTLLNAERRFSLYQALGSPAFARSSNFDVASGATIAYTNGGTLKTLTTGAVFDTGTTKTITGSLFGAAILSESATPANVLTWATGAGYASEALAIAALVDPGPTTTILGYISVQAHASGFTAGTDALTGGAGGNVATATTYYNAVPPHLLPGAAVS
jgi:hypothetical protein